MFFLCIVSGLEASVYAQFKSYFPPALPPLPFHSLSLAPLHSMSDILSLRAKPFNLDFNYHVSFVIRL